MQKCIIFHVNTSLNKYLQILIACLLRIFEMITLTVYLISNRRIAIAVYNCVILYYSNNIYLNRYYVKFYTKFQNYLLDKQYYSI